MDNKSLTKVIETLRLMPNEFSKSFYNECRPRRVTPSIETLLKGGFVSKVREDEVDKEIPVSGYRFDDGTTITEDEREGMSWDEWHKYCLTHEGHVKWIYKMTTKTIKVKRYIYRANMDALTAEVNKRMALLAAAL